MGRRNGEKKYSIRRLRFSLSRSVFLVVAAQLCAGFIRPDLAMAQAGALDKSFGNGGIFLGQGAGLSNTTAAALAIQNDGDILVAGGSNGLVAAVRLTPNGTLDSSFGKGGLATVNLGHGGGFSAVGAVVQSDGQIVLAISNVNADDALVLELARLNPDGTLDSSFGINGILTLVRGGPNSEVLAQQADGKILVAGGELMVRINPDGSLDSTFGTNGFATLIAGAGGIAFQPNSQIVVGASRYNGNGGLDTGFGILGRAPSLAPVSPVRLQSDGKIVALGGLTTKVLLGQLSNLIMHTGFELIRYNPNGSIDNSFGHHGAAITDFSSVAPFTSASDLVIEPNGDIIVVGQAAQPDISIFIPGPSVFALARYTSNGQLDPAFGSGGKVVTSFGSNTTAGIAAATFDGAGRLVAAGNAGGITVARYLTQ